MPSRFEACSRPMAWLIMAMLAAIMAMTALTAPGDGAATAGPSLRNLTADSAGMSDLRLYDRIRDRVAAGESYYTAAARFHREGNYPLKPFVTVRLPTLAYLSATLGAPGTQIAMLLLVVGTAMAWSSARAGLEDTPATGRWMGRLVATSCAMLAGPAFLPLHECWAGVLIALSLALWCRGWLAASLLAGLAAALIRELAVPYLCLMGFVALTEQRWREAAGWALMVAMAGLALIAHAQGVAAVIFPEDVPSPGWDGFGGWRFYAEVTTDWSLLALLPVWIGRGLVPLALFGWLSWNAPLATRVTGLLAGYAVLMMVFARPDNHYWSVLTMPVLLAGLALAVPALSALMARAQPGLSLHGMRTS